MSSADKKEKKRNAKDLFAVYLRDRQIMTFHLTNHIHLCETRRFQFLGNAKAASALMIVIN